MINRCCSIVAPGVLIASSYSWCSVRGGSEGWSLKGCLLVAGQAFESEEPDSGRNAFMLTCRTDATLGLTDFAKPFV